MKAKIDPTLCTGCGLCPDICPQVFVMDDDLADVDVEVVPPDAEDTCRDAAESCPVEAISIEE